MTDDGGLVTEPKAENLFSVFCSLSSGATGGSV